MRSQRVANLFISMMLGGAVLFAQTDHKYIGVNGCKTCHKGVAQGNQFEIWEQSKHAKAFEALKSPAAEKIAKDKGLKVPASEAPECLQCHTTGFGKDASLFDQKFDKTMGVQCEACHGAGFDFRGMVTMKDRNLAISKGLNPILVSDGTAEKFCKTCHNEKSPTFKGFNFNEAWKQIQHPRLKK